jgi:hypothetical protein
MKYVRERAKVGGMKSQNKGPRMRLKLNMALHYGMFSFQGPSLSRRQSFS